MVLGWLAALALTAPAVPLYEQAFRLEQPAEVVATVTAGCERCDWGAAGREAAVLSSTVDGGVPATLVLFRGDGSHEYRVLVGRLEAGEHRLSLAIDRRRSARAAGSARVDGVSIEAAVEGDPRYDLLAHAPFLWARRGSLERFSDVPLVAWVESLATDAGRELRYSVVFSNEDGGTPVDRLMATWGRLTDIELVYAVVLDQDGRVRGESYQADGHRTLPFRGRHEGLHPVLYVATTNNMVSDRGKETARLAPAFVPFTLDGVSREAVMDAEPWTYHVSAQEVRREGRVSEGARPGSKRIPDPRRFAVLEGCGAVQDARLAFEIGIAAADGPLRWVGSDGGRPDFRIGREGCFRSAIAVPPGLAGRPIEAVRVRAYTRPPGRGGRALPPGSGRARLDRITRLFRLGEDDQPLPSLLSWTGPTEVPADAGPRALEPVATSAR